MAGGDLLYRLRKQRSKSLEYIALAAGITYTTLWKIEHGETRQPARAILDAILKALDDCAPVSMEERCAVYAAFGYRPHFPLPEAGEIDEARRCWLAEYNPAPFPAYLIHVGQKVLACNGVAPRMVGLHPRDRRTQHFANATTFDLTFGLAERFVVIENAAAYRHSFVGALKRELYSYEAEDWHAACIAAAQRRYPEFKRLWAMKHPPPDSAIGCPIPLRLCLPASAGLVLTFRRLKAPFTGDPRFHTVLWLPDDAATWRAWNDLDFW